MIINTERLVVRPIVENDWQSIQSIWVDIKQNEYAKYDNPKDTDDEAVRTRIAKWANANRSGTDHIFFAVCLHNKVIGYIAFNIREDNHEIGYCFHSLYHGKGYAKESHLAIINNIHRLGIKKLTARTAMDNTPSVRLLQGIGFKLIDKEKVSFYKDDKGNDIVFDGGIFELEIEEK